MKTSLALLALLLGTLLAASVVLPRSAAPRLQNCKASDPRDLGSWDDALVCQEKAMLILRRGETLYSLAMAEGAQPKEIATAAALADTRMHACIPSGENLWVFLNSTQSDVFAVEVRSGKVVEFKIPNLALPGSHAPQIQSYVSVPHAHSVILMISGGDHATWPRDGNRPLFFWMSLQTGQVVSFPIGWDAEFFSSDERIAVFEKIQVEPFKRRPLQAVDMETGKYSDALPDRKTEAVAPFDWPDTQAVKPIYGRREKTGDISWFQGISVNGQVLPMYFELEKPAYLTQAMEADGFVGFRLNEEGSSSMFPSSLWLVKAENPATPELVDPAATDFTVLGSGNILFATDGHGAKKSSTEVFFRAHGDKATWNVLDGVSRLPELGQKLAEKRYIEDRMTVRQIPGFGSGAPIALCLFWHYRADGRSFISMKDIEEGKTIESQTWRRALIVTSRGDRYLTDLFREGGIPDIIWLQNSGLLITGYKRAGQIHLSAYTLKLP